MERLGSLRIETERELIAPPELEAGLRQGIITLLRTRVALGQVSGVGCDLVGDDTGLDVIAVRQTQMLLRGDVAQHRGAVAGDLRRPDRRSDVIVTGSDVGHERAEGVEGRAVAQLLLALDVLTDPVQRNVARSFDLDLHIVLPRPLSQLSQRVELSELRGIVGIGDRTRGQAVA